MAATTQFEEQLVPCAMVAIDAVGHSRLVRDLSPNASHTLFDKLQRGVETEVLQESGTLLGWAGDGGIACFTAGAVTDDEARAGQALRAAQAILLHLTMLNDQHELAGESALKLRLALHRGEMISRRIAGSIHSKDVNFVAHLEHALPENVIGLSKPFHTALSPAQKRHCFLLGNFETHDIYVYAPDTVSRAAAEARFRDKQLKVALGETCIAHGLVHVGFRDREKASLPPPEIYSRAESEIFMMGATLARSFSRKGKA
jgi:class 3 adenylate cyclase